MKPTFSSGVMLPDTIISKEDTFLRNKKIGTRVSLFEIDPSDKYFIRSSKKLIRKNIRNWILGYNNPNYKKFRKTFKK